MAEFIDERSRHGIVYIHCKIGYSRSAAAIAAYLIMCGKANTIEEAFALIRRARPSIVIRPEVVLALAGFKLLHAQHFSPRLGT
jgi:protein-tyrosine phosphatase